MCRIICICRVGKSAIHDVYEMSGLVVAEADADGFAIARPHRKRVDFKL